MEKNKAKQRKSRTADVHRIVIVGSDGVGKSALTIQFMYDEFVEYYESNKIDAYRKNVLLDDKKVMVHIWDTTGQDGDSDALDSCLRSGEGFLCVFSITDHRSFQAATELRERVLRVNDKYKNSGESAPFTLVGSKADLTKKRKVTAVEAESKASEWGVPYVETSALKRNNIDKVFFDLMREMSARKKDEKEDASGLGKKKKRRRKKLKCTIL